MSEALEVTPNRLDFEEQRVLLRTLKQNKQKPDKPDRYRLVELPRSFLASLESNFQARSRKGTNTGNERIWSFIDRTGQNYIKKVMVAAGISGIRASSRGLRHSMGVMLALEKVPVNVIQDILGHKFPESTQIHREDRRRLIAGFWQAGPGSFLASAQWNAKGYHGSKIRLSSR